MNLEPESVCLHVSRGTCWNRRGTLSPRAVLPGWWTPRNPSARSALSTRPPYSERSSSLLGLTFCPFTSSCVPFDCDSFLLATSPSSSNGPNTKPRFPARLLHHSRCGSSSPLPCFCSYHPPCAPSCFLSVISSFSLTALGAGRSEALLSQPFTSREE